MPSELMELLQQFLQQDAARRTGQAGDPGAAALEDRRREGALVAGMVPTAAEPLALPIFGAASGGYELAKALGLNKFLPGPLKADESTSPASFENVLASLSGFTGQSGMNQMLQPLIQLLTGGTGGK